MKFINLKSNQKAGVSFFTLVILSVLLSIFTIAMLRQSATETRESTDDDLSVRALYGAEAGVEDARVALRDLSYEYFNLRVSDPTFTKSFTDYLKEDKGINPESCGKPETAGFKTEVSPPDDLDIHYTCLKIIEKTAFDVTIETGEENVSLVTSNELLDGYKIQWHKMPDGVGAGDPGDGPIKTDMDAGGKYFFRKDKWLNEKGWPAVLRVTVFFEDNSVIRSQTGFLYPHETTSTTREFINISQLEELGIINADCDKNAGFTEFACEAQIADDNDWLKNSSFVAIATEPIYRGTKVNISGLDENTTVLGTNYIEASIPETGEYIIDSTGRANDVFRRIQVEVSLNNFKYFEISGIESEEIKNLVDYGNYASSTVVSGNSLCKLFETTDTVDTSWITQAGKWCDD